MSWMFGVVVWVSVGFFAAWIATKVMAVGGRRDGPGNFAVGMLGALVGGFVTRSALGDGSAYDAVTVSGLGAFVGASALIGLASLPLVRVWRARHAR
jgi:uncharacterized membrane protein YeaQ/YmgE (transglycosylase-associated protein family)